MSDSEGFESADEEGPSSDEAPAAESSGKAQVEKQSSHTDSPDAAAAKGLHRGATPQEEDSLSPPRAPPSVAAAVDHANVEPSEQKLPVASSCQDGALATSSREGAGNDDVCAKKIFDRLSEATERGHQTKAPATAAAAASGVGGSSSWGGWGKWSSAILSTAVSSVSTFTGQVGEGLNAVLGLAATTEAAPETPADGVGGRAASELRGGEGQVECSEQTDDAEAVTSQPLPGDAAGVLEAGQLPTVEGSNAGTVSIGGAHKESSSASDWFAEWGVQGLAATVQSGTRSLVSTGLDVLESIGKKTVAVLAETDPGLKKTKSLFGSSSHKPSLSQLLREAKQRGEQPPAVDSVAMILTYSDLLEQVQGLAHFEALEMLSQKCSADLATVDRDNLDEKVSEASSILDDLAGVFAVDNVCTEAEPQEHSFVELISDAVGKLALPLSTAKLAQAYARAKEAVDKDASAARPDGDSSSDPAPSATADRKSAVELLHDDALRSLAELTACALELYHKFGELLLHGDADAERSAADYKRIAEDVARITRTVCNEVTLTSSRYTDRLGRLNDAAATENITSVFFEATKSNTYIQDGFCLLLPIVQKAFADHCLTYGR